MRGIRPSRLERITRLTDIALASVVIISVAFLAWRTRAVDSPDLIPDTPAADLGFAALGAVLCFVLLRRGRQRRIVARGAGYLVALLLGGMAYTRFGLWRYEQSAGLPLTFSESMGDQGRESKLRPVEAAAWALRVALHAASGRPDSAPTLAIPDGWPLPALTRFGVRTLPGGDTQLWARVEDAAGTATCHGTVVGDRETNNQPEFTPRCEENTPLPDGLVVGAPIRGAAATAMPSAATGASPWLQHRRTPRRDAVAPAAPTTDAGWHVQGHTQVRTGTSIVGDVILLGGHGSGLVVAFDRPTGARRWAVQLPNWIHQDPVSDGQVVVVGFGDNEGSFHGRAPSGIAALDLVTGRRLWTEFEVSSVMTSPAIRDSTVIYATSQGLLRERRLTTGLLLRTLPLPGEVVMGPPVLSGDTLVATLDGSRACAVDLAPLQILWCHQEGDLRMLGHASAAIDGDLVVVSGVATTATLDIRTFVTLSVRLQAELLRALLFPAYLDYRVARVAGQRLIGLSLRTGEVRWRSPLFAKRRAVDGHTAGTAALRDGVGVIVLPVADTVVAFDTETGAIRWTSGANQARGAPLILGDRVIIAGRNGVIEVRQLADGALRCTVRRAVGWDRAGPSVSGDLAIFANLDGEVEAIPTTALLGCSATGASPPSAGR